MRRVLRVVLPIAFSLSILISCSSFLQSMDLSCINQFINRKAVFLFCNAILLFVLRDSGLLAPSASSGVCDEIVPVKRSGACKNLVQNTSQPIFVSSPITLSSEPIGPSPCNIVVEEKREVGALVVGPLESGAAEEEEEVSEESEEVVGQRVSEEELLGVEELNRRCEEFIEKVKRERQNEAKQFGIMV